jgi:hypothetical protein
LESELSSITFYQSGTQVFGYINRLITEKYTVCKLSAAVKASFNPLAAYFQHLARVKSISQSSQFGRGVNRIGKQCGSRISEAKLERRTQRRLTHGSIIFIRAGFFPDHKHQVIT